MARQGRLVNACNLRGSDKAATLRNVVEKFDLVPVKIQKVSALTRRFLLRRSFSDVLIL